MATSAFLFALVKTLTPDEIRRIRLDASQHIIGSKNRYLLLFEYLVKLPKSYEYNEDEVKAALAEEISPRQFSQIKNYLDTFVSKSLRIHRGSKNKSDQVRERIDEARIMFDRGLYDQCAKRLHQSKRDAYELELWHELLIICELERRNMGSLGTKDIRQIASELSDEICAVHDRMTNLHYYASLYDQVYAIVRCSFDDTREGDVMLVKDLILDKRMHNINKAKSLHAQKFFCKIRAQAAMLFKEYEEACDWYARLVELWQGNPQHSKESPRGYIIVVTDYAGFCLRVGRYEEFAAAVYSLQKIAVPTARDAAELFQNVAHLKLLGALNLPKLEDRAHVISELDEGLKLHLAGMNPARVLALYHNAMMLLFLSGDFRSAINWNVLIISERKSSARRDIIVFAHLLELVLHYEAGDHDLIERLYRNNRRFITQYEKLNDYERELLNLMRRLPALIDKSKFHGALKQLRGTIASLLASGMRDRLGLEELWCWLESRISSRPIAEVYRELKQENRNP